MHADVCVCVCGLLQVREDLFSWPGVSPCCPTGFSQTCIRDLAGTSLSKSGKANQSQERRYDTSGAAAALFPPSICLSFSHPNLCPIPSPPSPILPIPDPPPPALTYNAGSCGQVAGEWPQLFATCGSSQLSKTACHLYDSHKELRTPGTLVSAVQSPHKIGPSVLYILMAQANTK